MIDHDELTDQLHELGRRAPLSMADPRLDVRRGRAALRRRRARRAGGIITVLVAFGVTATQLPGLDEVAGTTALDSGPTAGPSDARPSLPAGPAGSIPVKCSEVDPGFPGTPAVRAAVGAYQRAAAEVLDPAGTNVDRDEVRKVTGFRSSTSCDPVTDAYLVVALGANIGWTAGGRLGVVQVAVSSPEDEEGPEVLHTRAGWTPYGGPSPLPPGVVKARVARYTEDGGGHAVVVERADGLTVSVDASGVYGNNVAPGSPPATELPELDRMLELAASPELAMPEPEPTRAG